MKQLLARVVTMTVLVIGQARADDHALGWAVSDNDLWALRRTDVDYSSGLEAHLGIPLAPPLGASWLFVGGAIGQAIFTPPDLRETRIEVLRRDRPYAGWSWGKAAADAAWGHARLRLDARAGVVGPHAYAAEAQRTWHSTNRAPDPKGWQLSQVADTPDLAVRPSFGFRVARIDLPLPSETAISVDLTPEVSCEVGALRVWCGAGALLRLGMLRGSASSSAPTLAMPVEPPLLRDAEVRPFELFGFGGAEVRRSWRDRLLEGDVCEASGCGPSWVKRDPWVVDLQVGLAATKSGWLASFAYIVRSPEVTAPAEAVRAQRFGRVVMGRAW